VSELRVEPHAQLDLVRLQREGGHHFHVSDVHVELARESRFRAHDFSLGGALVRKDVSAQLAGEGAECTLDGLYIASSRELVDNHTLIDHARPHGTSRELYKGILSGAARGVFHGRIVVREGARKTDARQTNKNLLLSRDAEVDSKPQLEISADDVKCSHGSTIGQLDEASLFYLLTRGIDAPSARRFLMRAFASEVTCRIGQEPLRDEIEEILLGRLAREEAL
jgi:Fe-S cluster assembly protein SufD